MRVNALDPPRLSENTLLGYEFRSNSDLCLTGDLRQMLPGVIAYGIRFDLNPYLLGSLNTTLRT